MEELLSAAVELIRSDTQSLPLILIILVVSFFLFRIVLRILLKLTKYAIITAVILGALQASKLQIQELKNNDIEPKEIIENTYNNLYAQAQELSTYRIHVEIQKADGD